MTIIPIRPPRDVPATHWATSAVGADGILGSVAGCMPDARLGSTLKSVRVPDVTNIPGLVTCRICRALPSHRRAMKRRAAPERE